MVHRNSSPALAVSLPLLLAWTLMPAPASAAGNVEVSIQGGTLVIRGDAVANSVVITRPDAYRVAPGDGTTAINGSVSAKDFTATKGIRADLGGGSDALVVAGATVSGPLQIRGDDGTAVTLQTGTVVEGNLTCDGGTGFDGLSLNGTLVQGKVSVRARDGGSSTVVLSGSEIRGDLKIDARDGFDALTVMDSTVDGRTSLKAGDGGSSTSTAVSALFKGLKVQAKEGFDAVSLAGPGFIGRVDLSFGNGGSSVSAPGTANTIEGNLRIKAQDGFDSLSLAGTLVNGNLQWSTKNGGSNASLFSAIAGNVALKHAGGFDSTSFEASLGGAGVGGKVKIQNGPDGANVSCDEDNHLGDTKVSTKDGFASHTIGFCSIFGSLSVDAGRDGGNLNILGNPSPALIAKNLSFKLKSGNGTVQLNKLVVQGKTSVRMSKTGNHNVTIDDVALDGPLSIKTGNGGDNVLIETIVTASPTESTMSGKVNISTAGGNDQIVVGAADSASDVNFAGKVTYDGGKDTDTLDHNTHGNDYAFPPTVKGIETQL
jgi:hypothetical protein